MQNVLDRITHFTRASVHHSYPHPHNREMTRRRSGHTGTFSLLDEVRDFSLGSIFLP